MFPRLRTYIFIERARCKDEYGVLVAWHDFERGKKNYPQETLSQCTFGHNKYQIEPGLPY